MFVHQTGFGLLKSRRFQAFGGPLLKGHARQARPFSKRLPMLFVMKSAPKAHGRYDLLRYQRLIQKVLGRLARKMRIQVIAYSQLNGRHIHFVIQSPSREAQANFLRALSGLVARAVWSAERGRPAKNVKNFWAQRPYSQLLSPGPELSLWKRFIHRKGEFNLPAIAESLVDSLSNTS
jgi:hypothetical protein